MHLLIVTQKVDLTDPILGFFHRWIEEFAMQCETVTVVGQKVGQHDLPGNVRVVSLGKENGASYLQQIRRFRSFIKQENYDAVLVHMTPIWVVLGMFAFKKPVYLWYEARGARWPLHIALRMVRKVFSASKAGMPIATSKSMVTGHGIDTDLFQMGEGKRTIPLITVGRITQSKNLPAIMDAAQSLHLPLKIIGAPLTDNDHLLMKTLKITGDSLSQAHLIPVLQSASIFLHASTTSLDKAVLEAMACGCIVVSSAEAFKNVLPKECVCTNETMAETVQKILSLPEEKREALRKELREIVVKNHSLPRLIDLLVNEMNDLPHP